MPSCSVVVSCPRVSSLAAGLLVAALASLFIVPPVQAAPLKMLELDDMRCTAWKATKPDPELREPYVQWVRGFLSGHNYANQSAQVSEVSRGTVEAFVDRFCNENAGKSVSEAAMRMSDRYSGRNAPIVR